MNTDVAEVSALAEAWTQWQTEPTFPFTPDHCINGTRVAIEVLRRFGIRAQPLSVRLMLFNRFGWDLFERGIRVERWPTHAWSIGVAETNDPSDPGKWHGHLVAEGHDWTLDLSASQFNRPGRIVSGSALAVPIRLPQRDWARFTDEHAQTLLLNRWPENNGWRLASGWRRPPPVPLITEIERRTIAVLDRIRKEAMTDNPIDSTEASP